MRRDEYSMAAGGLLPFLLAGCLSSTAPPETLLWEGMVLVEAGGPAGMSGSVAMVATLARTEVGIGLTDAPPDAQYGWVLREGTCAAPAQPASAAVVYPLLVADATGAAQAETAINRRLSGMQYAVQVLDDSGGPGVVLACGDLLRAEL